MKFSQRIGQTSAVSSIQLEDMSMDLRNMLWNGVKIFLIDKIECHRNNSYYDFLCQIIWMYFYKLPIDTIPSHDNDSKIEIRSRFFNAKWFEVYDFLEFLCTYDIRLSNIEVFDVGGFQEYCNIVLERENSWYRFIEGTIAPITNSHEIEEIEEAINSSWSFTGLSWVNIHLRSALKKISDKKNLDYRNSIKESISAVESVAKKISNNPKDSLGWALDKIKGKIKIHSSLEQGFKKIYWYTSDTDGIRHSLVDESACDFEDAKFMLISCSAFINYLISKANKAWINLK